MTNDQVTCLDANPAAEALLGYRRDELQKLSIRDVVVETERERFATLWEVLPINGPGTDEFTMLRKDGGTVTVEYHAVANIIFGLHLAVLRGVTTLKQAQ